MCEKQRVASAEWRDDAEGHIRWQKRCLLRECENRTVHSRRILEWLMTQEENRFW